MKQLFNYLFLISLLAFSSLFSQEIEEKNMKKNETKLVKLPNENAASGQTIIMKDEFQNSLMTIQSDGNVGIGSTNPEDKLHIVGDFRIDDASPYLNFYSGSNLKGFLGFWTNNNLNIINKTSIGKIALVTNSLERMTITFDGNVGIGTISPSAKLEVLGQVKITGGSPGVGKVLTSDANGLATWGNSSGNVTYSIGDFAQGGIVFWVDETGLHGLVCTETEQSTGIRWSNGSSTNTEAHGDGIGAGEMNTTLIIANQGSNSYSYAAGICANLVIEKPGVKYGDWYLPSLEELKKIFYNLASTGISPFPYNYWSSTEYSTTDASFIEFFEGEPATSSKSSILAVRAVRGF